MAWRELSKPWHDTTVDYCDVCGNLLIRRFWLFRDQAGGEMRACRQDDQRLWERLQVFRARAAEMRSRAAIATSTSGTVDL